MEPSGSSKRHVLPAPATGVLVTARSDVLARGDASPAGVRIDLPTVISPAGIATGSGVPALILTPQGVTPPALPASQPPLHPIEVAKTLRGESLDHFVLEDYVGVGGMGMVFRARDTMLNRTVAVKVLSGDQSRDIETRKRFRNEAQSAARLDHENIARVYYIGEARGLAYIVFEFIEGINVRDLVGMRGKLSLTDAVSYTLQIAGALAHASSRDVVHRDVKPSNILITPDNRAKLVDMGLARLHVVDDSRSDLTASGVTLGTFDYISPEQARDPRNVDVRSDIYSLGCTFYYMLAGRPPFPEGTMLQKLLQHQGEAPPDPRDVNPKVPLEAAQIVRRMMAKDPARRYQTPMELITDLMMLAGDLGLRSSGPAGMVWVAPETLRVSWWERHLPWLAPITLLLAAVGLLEFASSNRIDPSGDPLSQAYSMSTQASSKSTGETPDQGKEPVDRSQPKGLNANRGADSPGSEKTNTGSQPERENRKTDSLGQESPVKKGANNIQPDPLPNQSPSTTKQAPPDSAANPAGGEKGSPTSTPASQPGKTPIKGNPPDPETTRPTTPQALTGNPEGGTAAAAGATKERTSGFLVRHRDGKKLYPTLAAAYAASREEAEIDIELRFDGRRVEKPITLDTDVTLHGGEGLHPVLAFQHDEGRGLEPVTQMVTLVGGQLTVLGVSLEMDVPSGVSIDRWALFRARGCRGLTLRDSSITVRNPSGHLGVAFIDLTAIPGTDAMMTAKLAVPPEPIMIELSQCVVRGEATFLRSYDLQPAELHMQNGFLAIGKPFQLLQARGGQVAPRSESRSRIVLDRVTALVRGGLCRLDSEAGHAPLTPEWVCRNSVLIGEHTLDRDQGREDASPLIEQVGVESISIARQKDRVVWNGERVAYARFNSFWRVSPTSDDPQDMAFASWQEFWMLNENSPRRLDVRDWKQTLPKNDRPVTTLSPDSFQLADDTNPLGAEFSRLPPIPPAPDPPRE